VTARARIALGGAALLGPLLAFPTLLARPKLAIAAVLGAVVCFLASRSVAYPLALWTLPGVAIALLGTNPFPNNSVELFMVGWLVLALFLTMIREENALPLRIAFAPPVLLTLGLAVLMLARLGDSAAPSYGSFKLQLFLAENVTFLVAGVVAARRRDQLNLWSWMLLGTVSLGALVLVRALVTGQLEEALPGRFALYEQAGPISLARGAATGLLLAVFVLLVSEIPWRRLLALALVPALAVAFIGAGSRGPVLGLIVGLAVLLTLTFRDRFNGRRLLLLLLGIVVAIVIIPQLVPGQNVTRSLSVLIGGGEDVGGGSDANGRVDEWHAAWNAFGEHPLLGIGTGSFAHIDPIGIYPHNILLEAASELGILGLTFVVALLAYAFWMIARVWGRAKGEDRTHAALIAAFLAAAVTNALFSGDFTNNSFVWLAVGLTLGLMQRVVPSDTESEAWRRLRTRWRRHGAGAPQPLGPSRPSTGAGGCTIAAPADGSTVRGSVRVTVMPAGTGWSVEAVSIECSTDGREWREIAVAEADVDYDVHVVLRRGAERRRQVAVVRSLERANELRAAVESEYGDDLERVEILPSRKRNWNVRDLREAVWDTRTLDDGTYLLRAVTTDVTGRTAPSPEISVVVDNSAPSLHFDAPQQNAILIGPVEIAISARDVGSGVARVCIETFDGTDWKELTTLRTAPYKTGWNTSGLSEGDYRLRATAVDGAGNESTSREITVRVERVVSVITLEDPGERLSRVARLRAEVREPSRVKAVEFQVAPTGSFAWRALGTVAVPPFELDVDTLRLGEGLYDFRAVAQSKRGGLDASRILRGRLVDNVPPEVSMNEPAQGAVLRGSVPLSARAADAGSGVKSVLFQFSGDGSAWRPVVTRAGGPSSVYWDTTCVPDGRYLLRAVAGDVAANLGPSKAIEVLIDNSPPESVLEQPADGAELRGVIALRARADDAGSGPMAVRFELSTNGSAWRELGTATAPPFGLRWDTLALEDGEYRVRAVARDHAGNVGAGEPVTVRVVNRPAPPAPEPPPPEPVVQAPPPPPPPPAPVVRQPPPPISAFSLWQLEAILNERGAGHPLHDELEALLYTLRPYARPDGSIPERFWPLLRESFGELLP
jgi:O-antigen ligase